MMVVEQEPVPPRLLVSGIDRDLEVICLKCLQKPPELRYATAGELAADLEAYLAGETLSNQPSGLGYFLSRMLRETHHVGVLENWGLLWIWHSLATFVLCLLTQVLAWSGVTDHTTYLVLWTVGLITWGTILWRLRRRAGPVLFVERQLAHAWAAGVLRQHRHVRDRVVDEATARWRCRRRWRWRPGWCSYSRRGSCRAGST